MLYIECLLLYKAKEIFAWRTPNGRTVDSDDGIPEIGEMASNVAVAASHIKHAPTASAVEALDDTRDRG